MEFNVAEYMNERQLHNKKHETVLKKCPDKNAKLYFTLSGVLIDEISSDNISQSSYAEPIQQ